MKGETVRGNPHQRRAVMNMQALKVWLALALVFGLAAPALAQPQPPPTTSGAAA